MREQDFQKFYYTKVGLGEGCGCAERVIDLHEHDRLAGQPKLYPYGARRGVVARLAMWLAGRSGRRAAGDAKDYSGSPNTR